MTDMLVYEINRLSRLESLSSQVAKKVTEKFVMNATIKTEWYQTDEAVVYSVLIKNCKKENITIDFEPTELTVNIKLDSNREQQILVNLAHEIIPEKSSWEILSTRIEIKLIKKEFQRWNSLEPSSLDKVVVQYPSSSKKVLKS
jgi:hypothetical protein